MQTTKNKTFGENDSYSHQMRDRFLSVLYDGIGTNHAFFDGIGCARSLQRSHHIDTILNTPRGTFCIDEKIRRIKSDEKTNDLLIETKQNSINGNPGWIYTSQADTLLYCLLHPNQNDGLDVYWINMKSLQGWFSEYGNEYPKKISYSSPNEPEFITVPMAAITRDLCVRRYLVDDDGFEEIEVE